MSTIDSRRQLLRGNALTRLRELPSGSIDQVVTSPPYFRLRDYQVSGQLGLEPTIEQWVSNQRTVAAEIARLLVPTGSYWLNLADSYAAHAREGAAKKSLLLGPERLAQALIHDGWILRNKIVWHKPNPMPSSVRDRLNTSWESIYLFTRSERYFFDLDAIRQPHRSAPSRPRNRPLRDRRRQAWGGPNGDDASGLSSMHARGRIGHVLGKNPGDVWQFVSPGVGGGHHATFPLKLAERMIRAGCPELRCSTCLTPWRRPLRRRIEAAVGATAVRGALEPGCQCATTSQPGLVLDPFLGAGTTAIAAEALERDWTGIELNPDFADLTERRLAAARQATIRAP